MEKQSTIRRIWRECFPEDSEEWTDMYFRRTYSDESALTLEVADETVRSLLLQPYAMTFHGHTVAAGYISGAATRRKARGHGYMHTLLNEALRRSYGRGDMLCTLIPAHAWLSDFYARFGFSTVFYRKIERYTAVHAFLLSDSFHAVETTDPGDLYADFCRLSDLRDCHICHTFDQFVTIMEDNRLSDGIFRAVRHSDGTTAGMAWGVPESDSDTIRISELLYDSLDAREAVLHEIRCALPDRPITVWAQPPDERTGNMLGHGMARIVNVNQALSIISATHHDLSLSVRVTDPVIPQNCGTFHLHDGMLETGSDHTPDLDLTVDVLTSLLFSSHRIGDIMGIPSVRPAMTLMLD